MQMPDAVGSAGGQWLRLVTTRHRRPAPERGGGACTESRARGGSWDARAGERDRPARGSATNQPSSHFLIFQRTGAVPRVRAGYARLCAALPVGSRVSDPSRVTAKYLTSARQTGDPDPQH